MTEPQDRIFVVRYEVRMFRRILGGVWNLGKGLQVLTSGGKNKQGKTSWLKGLRSLFEGAGAIGPEPINDQAGDDASFLKAWLTNGWTIERSFTEANPKGYLKVRGPDPGVKGSQATLVPWMGPGVFDPMSFYDLSEADQTRALLALAKPVDGVPLEDVLEELDAQHDKLYQERTRHISDKRRFGKMPPPAGDRPERPDTQADMKELRRLQAVESDRRQVAQQVSEANSALRHAERSVVAAQSRLEEAKAALDAASKAVDQAERGEATAVAYYQDRTAALEAHEDPADAIAEVQQRLADAVSVQERYDTWVRYDDDQAAHAQAVENEARLTQVMANIDQRRKDALDAADIPVPGVSVKGGAIVLNDHALSEASGRERLVLAAHATAAYDPQLRTLLIDEANGVDEEGLAELAELAEDKDLQVIVCRLGSRDPDAPDAEVGDLQVIDGWGPEA